MPADPTRNRRLSEMTPEEVSRELGQRARYDQLRSQRVTPEPTPAAAKGGGGRRQADELEFDADTSCRPADLSSVLVGPPPSPEHVRQATQNAYSSWSWKQEL